MRRGLRNFFRRTGVNLASGFSLAMPIRMRHLRLEATLGQLIALLTLYSLIAAAADFLSIGVGAEYSPWGVVSIAAWSFIWLASLALVLAIDRGAACFLRVAVAMAGVLITQLLAWVALEHLAAYLRVDAYEAYLEWIWYAFLAWETAVFARVLLTVYDARIVPAAVYTVAYAGIAYASLSMLPSTPLFVEPWQPSQRETFDVEKAYYSQPKLLGQSLYALSPQRPDTVDVYFIGFAAYAHQDVFQREIEQATVIFEQQFDAIGRTVTLINNARTLNSVPLANGHNLDTAVRGIAERIDREQDILAIFLSSHGDEDATIAVQFGGFRFNDISARDVREILDRHAIKWRIVIVSACFSGSFIETLNSPETLIITAAAADRSSFGCSHDNEWTYFGEAYFGHALKKTASFVDAFALATRRISKRESTERKEPSLPQMSLGPSIGNYLKEHKL